MHCSTAKWHIGHCNRLKLLVVSASLSYRSFSRAGIGLMHQQQLGQLRLQTELCMHISVTSWQQAAHCAAAVALSAGSQRTSAGPR